MTAPTIDVDALQARIAYLEIREAHLEQRLAERTWQATTDPLTGLYNRRWLEETWPAERPAGLAVALVDLDHFKDINDTLGHAAGDAALVAVAAGLRLYGTAVRLGGDELLLLAAPDMLADLVTSWPVDLPTGQITVTGTVGVTTALADLAETLRRVDVAMYDAKRTGRGLRQTWYPELDATVPAGTGRRRVRDVAAAWPGEQPMPPGPARPMPAPTQPARRDDDEPTQPTGLITVDALPCGHIAGDLHDEECAYWVGVSLGWYPAPEAYLAGRAAA
ncbi:diguanylate cyclase (GGDEF) domain-containing protein [Micromonospora pallida]|uniref:Diguanylate cyclase (GGDEF) domain-containing protein n=1 Tax=Micromonospora pallida TaxID=145854 RepID=A0A1C6TP48_9ACTN|nr:GGDEF domain-containing protein [Micromonospora pallida]SCL16491.1 diguanylate cyclase (GGDEF) domain-containing protein [Micromonospora pallida]SCL43343.1 diguanylate cyclase (GGDEF) domain-containing protein [Micromonospora pallida]